ncbi:cytochrome P450 [Actinoallomurus acanthiterrae]
MIWVAMDVRSVREVLVHPALSRAAADRLNLLGYPPLGPASLLGTDGNDHRKLRDRVKDAFTKERVDALRPKIARTCDELIDAMIEQGPPCDLVESFALRLAMDTVGEVIGIPSHDRPKFREWGDAFLSTHTGDNAPEAMLAARQAMEEYLQDLIAQRSKHPADDLISAMIQQSDPEAGPDKALISLPLEIMLAGWETTAAAITSFTYWLLTNRFAHDTSHYTYLSTHPEAIHHAVEELFRMVPVGAEDGLPRCAIRDIEIDGIPITKGDLVVASHDAAHRDPEFYSPDPDHVDLTRQKNPHMAFGYGTHHCLGAMLGRLEVKKAIEHLTRRLPDLQIDVSEQHLRYKTGVSIRGFEDLPVRWGTGR